MTSSTGLASGTRSYTYDLDGNRLTKTEGGVTFTSVYDRADELVSVIKTGGSTQNFSYDAFGNMTGNAETAVAVTSSTYDVDNQLTAIDATGTANKATFTTTPWAGSGPGSLASSTETYSYVDTSETVVRVATASRATTDSIGQPAGDRLGVKVGAARSTGSCPTSTAASRPRSARPRARSATRSATTPTG